MWAEADISEGHGTDYSTVLACEHLDSAGVTPIEVGSRRLDQAAGSLSGLGHTPVLTVADGRYRCWPEAPSAGSWPPARSVPSSRTHPLLLAHG